MVRPGSTLTFAGWGQRGARAPKGEKTPARGPRRQEILSRAGQKRLHDSCVISGQFAGQEAGALRGYVDIQQARAGWLTPTDGQAAHATGYVDPLTRIDHLGISPR